MSPGSPPEGEVMALRSVGKRVDDIADLADDRIGVEIHRPYERIEPSPGTRPSVSLVVAAAWAGPSAPKWMPSVPLASIGSAALPA